MKDQEVKKLIQQETKECFTELKKSIDEVKFKQGEIRVIQNIQSGTLKRIETGLFGDPQFPDSGMTNKISLAYNYARRNIDIKITERGEAAIEEFNSIFTKENKEGFLGMLRIYMNWKAIFIGLGITSLVGLVNIFLYLADIINKTK